MPPKSDGRTARPIWRALAQIGRPTVARPEVKCATPKIPSMRAGNRRRWLNGTFRRIVSTGGKATMLSALGSGESRASRRRHQRAIEIRANSHKLPSISPAEGRATAAADKTGAYVDEGERCACQIRRGISRWKQNELLKLSTAVLSKCQILDKHRKRLRYAQGRKWASGSGYLADQWAISNIGSIPEPSRIE